jgi:2-keto-4-pentenoate hydratase
MDERVRRGMEAQLAAWRAALDGGARRVGWKVGLNAPAILEALDLDRPVVGYLTSATAVDPGDTHSVADAGRPGVEPELAIHVGEGQSVAGYGAALEVVDIVQPFEDLAQILADDIFHAAVALGPRAEPSSLAGIAARAFHNGDVAHEVGLADAVDPPAVVSLVAGRLEEAGVALEPGDVIIAGSLTSPALWVEPGDEVQLDLGPLGSVSLRFD